MVGAYDSVPVFNGLGKYNLKTDKEGVMTYEGVINMKTPKGTFMQFPFESQYIVARPSATASADKMNVMYAGLVNPITVSVPGVPNEKVRVTCDNGTLTPLGGGKYNVTAPVAGRLCKINISAETDSGSVRPMGVMEFRVKQLPAPLVYPSGATPNRTSASSLATSLGLVCTYGPDFNFDAKANVVSYSLDVVGPGGQFLFSKEGITGNQIPQGGKDALKNARRGTKVYFYAINAVGADGNRVKSPDCTYIIQ
jgi:gliding motility-associated protein GldM